MARNSGGRLNKLLEFIGLVDDEPEDILDEDTRSGRTYNPPSRRSAPDARPVRNSRDYESREPERYAPTGRVDANQRSVRQDYQSQRTDRGSYTARSADLSSSYDRYASSREPERSAPRQDTQRISARTDYSRYASSRTGDTSRQSSQRATEGAYRDEMEQFPTRNSAPSGAGTRGRTGNVINMRPENRQQTVIYYLRTLEECRDVINDLLDNKTVLLNLEDMEERNIQRGIDTLSGAAFALNATIRKASDKTYLIAPNNVLVEYPDEMDRRY